MVPLFSSSLGRVFKSSAVLSCSQAARCVSLNSLSTIQYTSARWFSEDIFDVPKPPSLSEYPKRPKSSFLRYYTELRPIIAAKHPGYMTAKISVMIGEKWRALTDAERQAYHAVTRLEFLKYNEMTKKYYDKFDPLDLRLLKNEKLEKYHNQKIMHLQRELRASRRPKNPRTSFQLFFSDNYCNAKAKTFHEKGIETTQKWNKLSSAEKQVYKQLSEKDKIRYINERKAWEERMMKIGREDLIQLSKRHSLFTKYLEKEKKESAARRNKQPKKQKKS